MGLRRPTELVLAHPSFRTIHEQIFMTTTKRPSYANVVGFDEPRWSLSHEKRLVHVLLELIASGIVSEDKLDLDGLIHLPALRFLDFQLRRQESEAKRTRLSDTPNVSRLSLDFPPSYKAVAASASMGVPG